MNNNKNVRVVARIHSHSDVHSFSVDKDTERILGIKASKDDPAPKIFSFSKIYRGSTLDIFNDEIESVLENERTHCFLAYGPTNSGKTYTIWGNEDSPGILAKAIGHLLDGGSSVQISAVEVYKSKKTIRDLLNVSKTTLKYQFGTGKYNDICQLLLQGNNFKAILSKIQRNLNKSNNGENASSSRGHCLVYVDVDMDNVDTSKRFCFADLAGLEPMVGAGNDTLAVEGRYINTELTLLRKVIDELRNKATHVSYRDGDLATGLYYFLARKAVTLVTCLQLSFVEKVTSRNITAISFALTASNIAKPAPTRTRGDSKLVLSKVFRSIEEVVDYCSSGEATIDKVADKLLSILHEYETPRDIEIHQMEQAGGDDLQRVRVQEQAGGNFEMEFAGDIPERLQVQEQPGGDDLQRVRVQEQAGGNFEMEFAGDIPERLQVQEQPGDVDPERHRDEDQRVRALTLDHLEQCRATINENGPKSLIYKRWTVEEITLIFLYGTKFKRTDNSVNWLSIQGLFNIAKARSEQGILSKWSKLQKTKCPKELMCRERANELMADAEDRGMFTLPR